MSLDEINNTSLAKTFKNEGLTQVLQKLSSSSSTKGTRRVTLVHMVVGHYSGKCLTVIMTNGTYTLSFVTQIF